MTDDVPKCVTLTPGGMKVRVEPGGGQGGLFFFFLALGCLVAAGTVGCGVAGTLWLGIFIGVAMVLPLLALGVSMFSAGDVTELEIRENQALLHFEWFGTFRRVRAMQLDDVRVVCRIRTFAAGNRGEIKLKSGKSELVFLLPMKPGQDSLALVQSQVVWFQRVLDAHCEHLKSGIEVSMRDRQQLSELAPDR